MFEEIIELFWKIIKFIIREIVFQIIQIIIFNIGRFSLLLITFGKYPKGYVLEHHYNRICFAGIFTLCLVWAAIVT